MVNQWALFVMPSGPPSTPSLLCGIKYCPSGKTSPQSWVTLSEQNKVFFQNNLVWA